MQHWGDCEWKPAEEGRHKFPLWVTLVAILICLIPIANVIIAFGVLLLYIIQSCDESNNDGLKLIDQRYVLGGKFFGSIKKLLNKRV